MKKLLFAIAAVAVTMTSCSKDETDDLIKNENPVITITSVTGTTVEAGSALELRISVRANDDGDKLKTFAVTRGDETIAFFSVSDINEMSLDTVVYLAASSAFETTVYTAVASDKNNNLAAKTISIATVSGFGAEKTGGFYHISAPNGYLGAYDLANDAMVAFSKDDSVKDMKNNDVIAFTGSWTSNNGTMYVKTTLDFDNSTYSSMVSTYATLSQSEVNSVTPVNGEKYIAKLRNGLGYAFIKITNVDPSNNDCGCANTTTKTGKITFVYKK
jgi:hypothetical protein